MKTHCQDSNEIFRTSFLNLSRISWLDKTTHQIDMAAVGYGMDSNGANRGRVSQSLKEWDPSSSTPHTFQEANPAIFDGVYQCLGSLISSGKDHMSPLIHLGHV